MMIKVKKYLTIVIFIFWGINANSQNLKYKDIYEVIKSGDYSVGYNLLFEYQRNNPRFANTYFQLGLISYYKILETDPLLEYDKIEYFHYNINLFWNLAKKFITEDNSEVTRNRKYYQNVEELAKIKKLSAPDVIDFINKHLRESEEIVHEKKKIHDIFYSMVNNYTLCVNYYRNIVADYSKLKDLYLAPKEDIFPRLDSLQHYFDNSVNMYEQYKAAITSYPLVKYHQNIAFKPIQLYRLDGITNTDFLLDTIIFWNYSVWIKQIKDIINTDIKLLRETVEREYNSITRVEKKLLSTKDFSDDYTGYYLLQKVIFQIEKYDLHSLISAILNYKKAKTDFLAFRLHKFNDTQDSSVRFALRANNYYQEQLMLKRLDTLLDEVEKLATPENIYKHKAFVSSHFPYGIPKYVVQERKLLNTLFDRDLQNYKYFIYRDILQYPFNKQIVSYKDEKIYLYPIADTSDNKYITLDVKTDKLGNIFVGGIMRSDGKEKPFIAKITSSIPQWVNIINIKDLAKVNSIKEFAYTDGVIVDVNYYDMQNIPHNYVVFYDQFGDKKNKDIMIKISYTPVYLQFDDINNILLLAYKGNKHKEFDTFTKDTLIIQKWNMDSTYLHWQKSFVINGSMGNIIKFDTTYYVFVNFDYLNYPQKNMEYRPKFNTVGVIKLSDNGKILSFKQPLPDQFYLLYGYKLSSKKINLLGFESSPLDLNATDYTQLPPLKSFIINKF